MTRSIVHEALGDCYHAPGDGHAYTVGLKQTAPGEVTLHVGGYPVLRIAGGAVRMVRTDNADWEPNEFKEATGLADKTDMDTGAVHAHVVFDRD